MDVEDGSGGFVSEAVGFAAGRLSFGVVHGDVGMAQVVGGAGLAYRGLDGWLPVGESESVVVEGRCDAPGSRGVRRDRQERKATRTGGRSGCDSPTAGRSLDRPPFSGSWHSGRSLSQRY
jgi:hypothetical protein